MRTSRLRTLAMTIACCAALVGCSAPGDDGAETPSATTDAPSASVEEQLLEALGPCEVEPSGYATTYWCDVAAAGADTRSMTYVIVQDSHAEAAELAAFIVEGREGDERFRGVAILDNVIIDTHSAEAMQIAIDMGAELLLEIGPE